MYKGKDVKVTLTCNMDRNGLGGIIGKPSGTTLVRKLGQRGQDGLKDLFTYSSMIARDKDS